MNKNKKFSESKKKLTSENIELRIENEVIKRQLRSVYNTIGEIINEPVKKEPEQKPSKCINCQQWGYYDNSFCSNCANSGKERRIDLIGGEIEKKEKKQLPNDFLKEAEKKNIEENEQKDQEDTDRPKFKCFQCQTVSDDQGAYKRHNGKLYCVDCLDMIVRGR